MFVDFILKPLWHIYNLTCIEHDAQKLAVVIKKLKLDISNRELNHNDPKVRVQAVLKQWMPLSEDVLKMIVRSIPNPIKAQNGRLSHIWRRPMDALEQRVAIERSISICSAEGECVLYVSRMLFVNRISISDYTEYPDGEEVFVGLARVFSGKLEEGSPLYIIESSKKNKNLTHTKCSNLKFYMIVGRNLIRIHGGTTIAGNIVGIVGL